MVLQHTRPWPVPLVHEGEELGEDGRTAGLGVELTDASDHDGPGDSTGIADDSAVDGATWTVSS
jgi:hypothetical protein